MKLLYAFFFSVLLCACAAAGIQNIDTSNNLNEKQSQAIAQEITLIIQQNYNTNKTIVFDSKGKNGQLIEQKLRLASYAIDKPNNHLPILHYQIKQDNNKIFININYDNKILNKAYLLTNNSLVATTPLTIIELK